MAQPTQEQLNKTYENDDAIGLPRGTTAKQIGVESDWKADAYNKGSKAYGYVQVIPSTLASISSKLGRQLDPTNFDDALDIHKYAMSENLKQFGNVPDALRAYNSGWKREKWNNPETNNYIAKITGDSVAAQTYAGPVKKPAKLSPLQEYEQMRAAHGVTKEEADAATMTRPIMPDPSIMSTDLTDEEKRSAAAMADTTHWAGAMETAQDTAYFGTLTGRLVDWANRGAATPGWKMNDAQYNRFTANSRVYQSDDLREYVQGAVSDTDFEKRLMFADDRAELQHRSANTGGLQAVTNTALSFATGMADPAAWALTMGLGAGLNTVRVAAGAARAGTLMAVTEGAVGNMAITAGMDYIDNKPVHAGEMIQQAIFGGLMGAGGHLIRERFKARAEAKAAAEKRAQELGQPAPVEAVHETAHADPAEVGLARAVDDKIDEIHNNPHVERNTTDPYHGTISHALDDVPATGTRTTPVEAAAHITPEAPKAHVAETAEAHAAVRSEEAAIAKEVPHLVVGAERGNMDTLPKRGVSEILTAIKSAGDELHASLATRLEEALAGTDVSVRHQPNLKALGHYDPATHSIVLRDLGDHTTALHETAHAVTDMKITYGLDNPNSAHGKIVSELEGLRQQAADLYKGNDHDAKYFMGDVREFVAGLYTGKGEFINHLASLEGGKSIVSKLFDAVRRLLGVEAADSSLLARAMGLSDDLIAERLNTTVQRSDGRSFGLRQMADAAAEPDVQSSLKSFKQTALEERLSQEIKDHVEVTGPAAETGRAYYGSKYRQILENNGLTGGVLKLMDSVGLTLGLSESKGARMWASKLAEDPTGINRQHGMSATLDKERLSAGFREPFIEVYKHTLKDLMSTEESVREAMGMAQDAHERIGVQVHEYTLAKRYARMKGVEFDATAYDPAIQHIGNNLDAFWGSIADASKEAGEPLGTAIGEMGFQGHTPQRWKWADMHRDSVENPEKFNALVQNFANQYLGKILNPALEHALEAGPMTPEATAAVTTNMTKKARTLTENYLRQVMTSPESRAMFDNTNHLAKLTEDLLSQEFLGKNVNPDMVAKVREKILDITNDRKRTEFDLLAKHENVRLLDYIDTDIGRIVDTNSSQFAGKIALTRVGLGSPEEIEALTKVLQRDGASVQDLSNINFLIRSLDGNLSVDETGVQRLMRQGAQMSMSGKFGFNAFSDASGMISVVGVSGMFNALGRGITRTGETELIKSIREFTPGSLAFEHRNFTPTKNPNVGMQYLTDTGTTLSNLFAKGADFAATVSGLKYMHRMMHNGFAPVFAEDLIKTIETGKGISEARMWDLGLTPERIDAIRTELATHNPTRQKGEAVDWSKWDQLNADNFFGAIQRGTGQALLRMHLGEAPRWVSETSFGKMMSQFKAAGVVATEKQMMRNAFIKDSNSVMAFTVGLGMAATMYRAKQEAGMLGMSDSEKRRKLEKDYSNPLGVASGMLSMYNMSGMGADVADLSSMLVNGQSYGTSAPSAAMSFLGNLKTGVSAVAGYTKGELNGESSTKTQKELRKAWRVVPGGNSPLGSLFINTMNEP